MSNRPVWNIRRRHEWLSSPLKGKHLSRRKRARIGLEQALQRLRGERPDTGASAPN